MFFCYELSIDGRPVPVLYYDEVPYATVCGKPREKLQVTDVSHHPTNLDGELELTYLSALYPYLLKKETSTAKDAAMTRPVEGFITAQGNFFDDEKEANLFEAHYTLTTAAVALVEQLKIDDPQANKELVEGVLGFIADNAKAVREWLDARDAFPKPTRPDQGSDEVGGPAAGDTEGDDTRVRSVPDIPVEDAEVSEDQPEAAGTTTQPPKDLTDL